MPKIDKEQKISTNLTASNDVRVQKLNTDRIKQGDVISLNLNREYSFNSGKVILNAKNLSLELPSNLTIQEKVDIEAALRLGILYYGEAKEAAVKKDPKVIETYLSFLNKRNVIEMRDAIIGVTRSATNIGGWGPREILEEMRRYEQINKARKDVMSYLEEAISNTSPNPFMSSAPFDPVKHLKTSTTYAPKYKKS